MIEMGKGRAAAEVPWAWTGFEKQVTPHLGIQLPGASGALCVQRVQMVSPPSLCSTPAWELVLGVQAAAVVITTVVIIIELDRSLSPSPYTCPGSLGVAGTNSHFAASCAAFSGMS